MNPEVIVSFELVFLLLDIPSNGIAGLYVFLFLVLFEKKVYNFSLVA